MYLVLDQHISPCYTVACLATDLPWDQILGFSQLTSVVEQIEALEAVAIWQGYVMGNGDASIE